MIKFQRTKNIVDSLDVGITSKKHIKNIRDILGSGDNMPRLNSCEKIAYKHLNTSKLKCKRYFYINMDNFIKDVGNDYFCKAINEFNEGDIIDVRIKYLNTIRMSGYLLIRLTSSCYDHNRNFIKLGRNQFAKYFEEI